MKDMELSSGFSLWWLLPLLVAVAAALVGPLLRPLLRGARPSTLLANLPNGVTALLAPWAFRRGLRLVGAAWRAVAGAAAGPDGGRRRSRALGSPSPPPEPRELRRRRAAGGSALNLAAASTAETVFPGCAAAARKCVANPLPRVSAPPRHRPTLTAPLPPPSRAPRPPRRRHRRSVSGEVSRADWAALRQRLAPMPAALPAGADWAPMFEKTADGMRYAAWRHVLPVRRGGGVTAGGWGARSARRQPPRPAPPPARRPCPPSVPHPSAALTPPPAPPPNPTPLHFNTVFLSDLIRTAALSTSASPCSRACPRPK